MTRRSLKLRHENSMTMRTPLGGIDTVDAGIVTGEIILSVEYNVESDKTSVFIRHRGSDNKLLVTGSPLRGNVTIENVLASFRSMKVGRDAVGNFLPFRF